MANTSPMVSSVSTPPAKYIQVAGGSNLAALKKFNVAGSVNLPTICGMKNSPQISRRILSPLVRSKAVQVGIRVGHVSMLPPFGFLALSPAFLSLPVARLPLRQPDQNRAVAAV